jgi:hypothetical protein
MSPLISTVRATRKSDLGIVPPTSCGLPQPFHYIDDEDGRTCVRRERSGELAGANGGRRSRPNDRWIAALSLTVEQRSRMWVRDAM